MRQAGVKLAVVSDGDAAQARAQFRELGWGSELFEVIVGADAGVRGPCGMGADAGVREPCDVSCAAGSTWRIRDCGRWWVAGWACREAETKPTHPPTVPSHPPTGTHRAYAYTTHAPCMQH